MKSAETIFDIIEYLKIKGYKFIYSGDDYIEFPMGAVSTNMFIEFDQGRPVLIHYYVTYGDNEEGFCETYYDEYSHSNYGDLDLEKISGHLDDTISSATEMGRDLIKIENHLEKISDIMSSSQVPNNVVRFFIEDKLDIFD